MNPQPHSRESLGIPSWFFCDGCSHSPDPIWARPACEGHDWDYWRGDWGEMTRAQADKDLRARIKHNAKFWPEGSWFDRRWRPWVGEIYYFMVVRFGNKAWRTRDDWKKAVFTRPDGEIDWESLAIAEGKHVDALR